MSVSRVSTVVLVLAAALARAWAGPSDFDPTFGDGGIATATAGSESSAVAMAAQPDGKIVVATRANVGGRDKFAVVRFLSNGQLDTSFAGTGVAIDTGGFVNRPTCLAIQPDGKIVVGGDYMDRRMVRWNANGTLDTSFGSGGVVQANYIQHLLALSDGTLLASTQDAGGLIHYTSSGAPDPAYGMYGVVPGDKISSSIGDLVLLNDGKILDLGDATVQTEDGPVQGIGIARRNADLTFDSTFGTNGVVAQAVGVQAYADRALVTANGRIFVAGYSKSSAFNNYVTQFFRFNPDGSFDRGFDGATAFRAAFPAASYFVVKALATQRDGRILAVGEDSDATLLLRLKTNGGADTTFAPTGGISLTQIKKGCGVLVQSDGKIVIAGTSGNQVALARFLGTPLAPVTSGLIVVGTPVQGQAVGTTFLDFSAPAVDSGNVGGTAALELPDGSKQVAVFGGLNATVQAQTGVSDGNGGIFTSLGDPVFGDEAAGVAATAANAPSIVLPFLTAPHLSLADISRGLRRTVGARVASLYSRLSLAGGFKRLASLNGVAPSSFGARYRKFPNFGLPRVRGGLVYSGRLTGRNVHAGLNDFGVWRQREDGNDVDLCVDLNKASGILLHNLAVSDPYDPAYYKQYQVRGVNIFAPIQHGTDQRRSFAPDGAITATISTVGFNYSTGRTRNEKRSAVMVVRPNAQRDDHYVFADPVVTGGEAVQEIPGARFEKFRSPATASGGYNAFVATLQAIARGGTRPPSHVVVVNRGGQRNEILARAGDPYPGASEQRFASFGDPLMGESGMVALVAALKGKGVTAANRKAIVQFRTDKTRAVVARLGEGAPDMGDDVVFQRFQSVVVTDSYIGRIVFTGTVKGPGIKASNRQGLWGVMPDGTVKLLLRAGVPTVIGGNSTTIRLFSTLDAKHASIGQGRSTDADGSLAAKVTLGDGQRGVLRIPLP